MRREEKRTWKKEKTKNTNPVPQEKENNLMATLKSKYRKREGKCSEERSNKR